MAGISRSVTLTIAYLMAHFGMSMQDAYQYVKDKRPAISPNLNFMGQLVEFERELQRNPMPTVLDIKSYTPSQDQKGLSEKLMEKIIRTNSMTGLPPATDPSPKAKDEGTSVESSTTAGTTSGTPSTPFVLKPLASSKSRRAKKYRESLEVQQEVAEEIVSTNNNNSIPVTTADNTAMGSSSTVTVTLSSLPNQGSNTPDISSELSSVLSSTHISSKPHPFPSSLHIETATTSTGICSKKELTVRGERVNLHDRSTTPPYHTSPERVDGNTVSPTPSS